VTELNTIDEILDFAIREEEKAYDFYTGLAAKMDKPWMKKAFEDFAKEELGHKTKLQKVKHEGFKAHAHDRIPDLKIADYAIGVEPSPDMNYQDALIVAMKAEKAAYKLYTDLAVKTDDENTRQLFLDLAREEANHKLKLETEYDDHYLAEN
jgi:rubrerythrin